jgi:hypothetical protein
MAIAKKPAPTVKKQPPVRAHRPAAPPPPPEEEQEQDDVPEEEEGAPPPRRQYGARAPQAPPQREKMTGFPEGSLFEGDRNSAVIFAGTFGVEELHALIEEAAANSTDPDKIRIKIFDVDEQYQKGPQHRVRINFAGMQPRTQGGSGHGTQKSWGRGSKRW